MTMRGTHLLRRAYEALRGIAGRVRDHHSVEDGVAVTGEVRVRTHDEAALRRAAQDRGLDYDELDKEDKRRLVESANVEPVSEFHTENTTVVPLHEYLTDVLDPNQVEAEHDAAFLAVGTDGTDPTSSDRALGNEIDRIAVTATEDRGVSLFTTTFVDTTEGNPADPVATPVVEVGLVSNTTANPWILMNHALITAVEKDSTKTMTIDVTLTSGAT